jgi:large subunit ribosomal protein L25
MELTAQVRQKAENKANSLRRQGQLPAVLYRKGKENVNLQLNYSDFEKTFKQAGESTLIKLKIEDQSDVVQKKEKNVLVADVARDPVTDKFIHVDFYEVKMDEKLKAAVPLEFIGESLAVKTEAGTLVKNLQEVEVRALPADLLHHIEVDISLLATFEDKIFVKDLKVSKAVEILAEPEEVVVLVVPPRKEEEIAPEAPAEEAVVEGAPGEEGKEEAPTEGEKKE